VIIATTESGAKYRFEDGYWWHRGDGPHQMLLFANADWDTAISLYNIGGKEMMFDYLRQLPQAKTPEVGASIYVTSLTYWRLSTPVVSVETEDMIDD